MNVKAPAALPIAFEPWALDTGGRRTLLLTGDGTLWMWGKPFGPSDVGLEVKLKRMVNRFTMRIGIGLVFTRDSPKKPDPVKVWSAPRIED